MIYIIILLYIIVLNIVYPKINKSGNYAYWFLYIILVAIAGFRYRLGVDTNSYTIEYQSFPTLFQLKYSFFKDSKYQILWILFESSLRTITSSFYLLQFVLAAFVNYCVFIVIKKQSVNPFFTILLYYMLYYVTLNMEILRESVAISLLLLGTNFLIEKKYTKYYILAIIAFLFHQSGIILFIIPFLLKIKMSRINYFATIILIYIFSQAISLIFLNYLLEYEYFNIVIKNGYFNSLDSLGSTLNSQIYAHIKYVLIPVILLFIFSNRLNEIEKKYIFIYIIFAIIYMQLVIFYRIRDYFFILFLLSITNGIFEKINNKAMTSFRKGIIIFCFLFVWLRGLYYNGRNVSGSQLYLRYYPYNSIFNEDFPQSRINTYGKIGSLTN